MALPAIASLTICASDRRSIEKSARAATSETTRPSTAAPCEPGPSTSVVPGAGGSPVDSWITSGGDCCLGIERERHPHLGSAASAGDPELVRQRGDQRKAEAERRPVTLAGEVAQPMPAVAHAEDEPRVLGRHRHLERAALLAVGVDDDVRARLGDRDLHVGRARGLDAEVVGEPGECLPHERHVAGCGRHAESDLGRVGRTGHARVPGRAGWLR